MIISRLSPPRWLPLSTCRRLLLLKRQKRPRNAKLLDFLHLSPLPMMLMTTSLSLLSCSPTSAFPLRAFKLTLWPLQISRRTMTRTSTLTLSPRVRTFALATTRSLSVTAIRQNDCRQNYSCHRHDHCHDHWRCQQRDLQVHLRL